MAGLNDDVEDGLDENFDPSIITPPNFSQAKPVEATVVTGDVAIDKRLETVDSLFGPTEAGELPNLDLKFKVIEDSRVNIIELKEVEQAILGQNAVSQESATIVDRYYGDFFNPKRTVNHFTKVPTKTMLDQTVQFMGVRIAKEESEFLSLTKATMEQPMEDLKYFEYQVQHVYLPYMVDQIRTIRTTFEQVLEDIEISKNTVLPIGNTYLNILTCPINHVPLKDLDFSRAIKEEENKLPGHFVMGMEALVNAFNSPSLCQFVQMTLDNKDYQPSFEASGIPEMPTLLDLVNVYKSRLFESNLQNVSSALKESINTMRESAKAVQEANGDFEELNHRLLEQSETIRSLTIQIQTCYMLLRQLINTNIAMKEIFEFLKFCL